LWFRARRRSRSRRPFRIFRTRMWIRYCIYKCASICASISSAAISHMCNGLTLPDPSI
jgi:hypothetical protein